MTQQPHRDTPQGAPPPAAGPFAPAHYHRFYDAPPAEDEDGARTWYARGQVIVIAYTEASPGAALERAAQDDEYGVLLPDPKTTAVVEAAGESATIDGFSLAFVPPGPSVVRLPTGGCSCVSSPRAWTSSVVALAAGRTTRASRRCSLGRSQGGRTHPLLLARRRAGAGLLRQDLPQQQLHGQQHRAVARAA